MIGGGEKVFQKEGTAHKTSLRGRKECDDIIVFLAFQTSRVCLYMSLGSMLPSSIFKTNEVVYLCAFFPLQSHCVLTLLFCFSLLF